MTATEEPHKGLDSTTGVAPGGDPSVTALPAEKLKARRRARFYRNGRVVLWQAGILAGFFVFWEIATSADRQTAFLFGSPSAIFSFLVQMWADGSLFRDTYVTGLETMLGFVLGNLLGTMIGLSLWYSSFVARVAHPFIVALGSIPIIALAPIVIIWFGTGLASKVAMATMSVVVVAIVTSYKGALNVDPDQINMMRTLGAGKSVIFRRLVVPSAVSDIFSGLRMTVGFALIGAIIGEFMSSSEGLGHAIFKAGSLYNIPKVFAALVATIALALFLTWLVGLVERKLTPWKQN
ncbi:ABC transporter permease [Roseobacter sp.]|uniref:ABC transporter permease n=1 Tax=Roseobacter sp. TaxID=1907202 RepID=UPI0038599B6A